MQLPCARWEESKMRDNQKHGNSVVILTPLFTTCYHQGGVDKGLLMSRLLQGCTLLIIQHGFRQSDLEMFD